jgi:YD repeat-containing protein
LCHSVLQNLSLHSTDFFREKQARFCKDYEKAIATFQELIDHSPSSLISHPASFIVSTVNWQNLGDAQNPAWRVTSIVDPLTPARTWTYQYNSDKNLWTVTDPMNRTVTYT